MVFKGFFFFFFTPPMTSFLFLRPLWVAVIKFKAFFFPSCIFFYFIYKTMLLQKLRCAAETPKCIWSNNLIHMVGVIPLVNIQLNMLSHSRCSVDLSSLNRCCLNTQSRKILELAGSFLSPLSRHACGWSEKEERGSKSCFRPVHRCATSRSGRKAARLASHHSL